MFKDMFDGMLGTWNMLPVDLELKNDTKNYIWKLIQYQN